MTVSLEGMHEKLRCRFIHDAVIFEDFTLQKGQPAPELVPPGPLLLQVYTHSSAGTQVLDERALTPQSDQELDVVFNVER